MRKFAVCFLGLMLLFTGYIIFSSEGTDTSGEPENLANISYLSIENDSIYYVDKLVVLDVYAVLNDDDVQYAAVMFQDNNGTYVVMNLPINEDDEIWDAVNDYMEDDTLSYGDLVLDCYVQTETNYNVEDKLHNFFNDWLMNFRIGEGINAATIDLRFSYVCDKDGDPYAVAEGANAVGKVMGVLTILAGIVLLIFGMLIKPKVAAASVDAAASRPAPSAPHPTQTASRPTQAPVSAPSPSADPIMEQLNRYKALKDAGYMTAEEFDKKRKELLGL